MFEKSLLELGSTRRANRPLATAVAFVLQAVLIGVLVLIPLLHVQALPAKAIVTLLVAPAPPPPPPPPAPHHARVVQELQSEITDTGQLRMPIRIPKRIAMLKDITPPSMAPAGGVIGGVPGGVPGGVIGGIIGSMPRSAFFPPPKPTVPKLIRVSQGVTLGRLVYRVQPVYPEIARIAHVQGTVQLQAIIARNGSVQDLQAMSGNPMLIPAAIEAVKQWRFKPYLLNGQPVKVETEVRVVFALG
jgi:periplasmic protein TonB